MAQSTITAGNLPNQQIAVFKGVVNNSNVSGLTLSNPIKNTPYFTSANSHQGFSFITGTNLSLSGVTKLIDANISNPINKQLNNDRGPHYNDPKENIYYTDDGGSTTYRSYLNAEGVVIVGISNQVINPSIMMPATGEYSEDLSLNKVTATYSLGKNLTNKDIG